MLYTDAGGASHGTIEIVVVNAGGRVLYRGETGPDSLITLAELEAIRIATRFADPAGPGAILSDSLNAVKLCADARGVYKLHPRASRVDDLVDAGREIRDALPAGWVVAWIPRVLNIADAALAASAWR